MAITKISPSVVDFDAGITITTDDNSNNLTLTSTDANANSGPNLDLYRNSSSPAASDVLGTIFFHGEDGAGNKEEYVRIQSVVDAKGSGSEVGVFQIFTNNAGTLTNNRFEIDGSGVTINESGGNFDFRVESDDHTHMLFVDAGNNAVGIKNSDPHDTSWAADGANTAQLSIGNTSSGSTYGVLNLLGHNTQATKYSIGVGDGIMYLAYDDVNAAHRLKVHSDGDFEVVDGNINMASGHGIDFSATSDATGSSSELLDDYEEGSWSPTISAGSVSGNQCQYTKVGNLVTLRGNLADITDNTTNGDIIITGLPYTAGSNNRAVGTAMFRYFSKTNAIHMNSYLGQNDTTLSFYWSFNAASSPWEVVEYDDGTQANMDIMFTIAYITT